MSSIQIAGVVRESIVDGPGIRFALFTQGCPHHCKGCHNPQSHNFAGGSSVRCEDILAEIDKNPLLSGVTFSGGEPFCQPESLCELAQGVKQRALGLMIYTGYTYEQLCDMAAQNPAVGGLMQLADYIVDGRFELAQRDLTLAFRGSRNQRVIDVQKTRDSGAVVTVEL